MKNTGWKTIVIDKKCELHKSFGYLIIKKEKEELKIPLHEIDTIIIESLQVNLTSSLINSLADYKIKLIFCDKNHNPSKEVVSYEANTYFPERLENQIMWEEGMKKIIWLEIIKLKIKNQADLLKNLGIKSYSKIEKLLDKINIENTAEYEAKAARMYFHYLFGMSFNRRTDNNINAALNYGYTLILSEVNRAVVCHGYSTCLGVNHHNCKNPFNLSCDIMEPFRPFVDEIVYKNKNRTLDTEYKKELLQITNQAILYNNQHMAISDAVNSFVTKVTDGLSEGVIIDESINFDI